MSETPDDPRPDGENVHTSTLALFCAGREAPQAFDIESTLGHAGILEEEVQDGPSASGDDVIWSRAFRVKGMPLPLLVFCVRREADFTPWEWTPARWRDQDEHRQTVESRWLLMLETLYPQEEPPNEEYHRHLQVASLLAKGRASACVDMQCMSLRSATTLHELAQGEVGTAPDELFAIHVVGGDSECWLHTHGLRRFDLPDLELLRVPRESLQDAYTTMQWLVSFLLSEYVPSDGGSFTFGAELTAALVPLEPMLAQLRADELGGAADRKGGEHGGWRVLVTDPADPPQVQASGLLQAVHGDPIFWLSPYENHRRASVARARFGLAAAAWHSTQFHNRALSVKVGIPYREDGGDCGELLRDPARQPDANREHMWFRVAAIEGSEVVAELESEPRYATWMRSGNRYRLPVAALSGFSLLLDDVVYGPDTINELDVVTHRTGSS